MSYSFTTTESNSFTVTHARHMAAKVATDLKRIQRLYGKPDDDAIAKYEAEITAFLKENFLGAVTYGFKRSGLWIEPTLRYTARDLTGSTANDDDPGRIRPGANVDGGSFGSFLTYSDAWQRLTDAEKNAFRRKLPFERGNGSEPGVDGYLNSDLTYSSGGRALGRATVRSFG
jgi:Bacterial HORMA domain family 1